MNCKQGDLAIIVGGSLNMGKIVRVVTPYLHRDQRVGGMLWNVPADEGFFWCVESEGSMIRHQCGLTFNAAPFPDRWLKPISGLPNADQTTEVEDVQHDDEILSETC